MGEENGCSYIAAAIGVNNVTVCRSLGMSWTFRRDIFPFYSNDIRPARVLVILSKVHTSVFLIFLPTWCYIYKEGVVCFQLYFRAKNDFHYAGNKAPHTSPVHRFHRSGPNTRNENRLHAMFFRSGSGTGLKSLEFDVINTRTIDNIVVQADYNINDGV